MHLGEFEIIQGFHKYLPYAGVFDMFEHRSDRLDKFIIQVPGEGLSWIVGQDANKHNGIVLPRWPRIIFFAQKLANDTSALGSGSWGRLGSVDDGGEEQDFIALK
jgi:hypothetical protein